jgi:hypothetical protein
MNLCLMVFHKSLCLYFVVLSYCQGSASVLLVSVAVLWSEWLEGDSRDHHRTVVGPERGVPMKTHVSFNKEICPNM